MLSRNYPERLKRVVVYPFPFWGRAVWSMARMFVDAKTARKIVFLPGNWSAQSALAPRQLFDYVAAADVPLLCGGLYTGPVRSLANDLQA
jgi:hypothetical protein